MNRFWTSSLRFARLLSLTAFLLLAGMCQVGAQGWEIYFGGPNEDQGQDIIQTQDHGYMAVGFSESFTADLSLYAVRTDVDGTLLWSNTYDEGWVEHGYSVVQADDKSFLVAGDIIVSPIPPLNPNVYLVKIAEGGELLWSKQFGGAGNDVGRKIIKTPTQGGYLIAGQTSSFGSGQDDFYLIKIDDAGNSTWAKPFGTSGDDRAFSVTETVDGYLAIGTGFNQLNNSQDILLLKTDFDGNELWRKFIGTAGFEVGYDLVAMSDGNFGILGTTGSPSDVFLAKVDPLGEIIWSETFGDSEGDDAFDLLLASNGDLVMCGVTELDDENSDAFLARYDTDGNQIWYNRIGRSNHLDWAQSIAPTADEGFVAIGYNSLWGVFINDLTLIKAGPMGDVYTNHITGRVVIDEVEDCTAAGNEPGLNDWIIKATSPSKTFFGTSDENGNFDLTVDSGDYVLSIFVKNDYWFSCVGTWNVSFNSEYETQVRNFPMQKVVDCPLLEVDISTPVVQDCSNMAYTVSYCNTGTIGEANPSIHIILDNDLTMVSSPLPYTSMDSLHIFELDSIGLDSCGSFYFVAAADCDGQQEEAYTASAHIFPDSICIPPVGWDHADVDVNGYCDADSVRFIIRNDGTGNMSQVQNFIVIEDQVLALDGEFILIAQSDTTITREANGSTYRIIAEQSPGHPGSSYPTVAVEGCTTGSEFSTGYTTEFQENENDPFISIDVQEAISSTTDYIFLRGYPKGYLKDGERLVPANTPLEYHIYFSNAGTDTIQRIVIRDTLPTSLDLGTVVPGASSHPYEFQAYSNGVLKFTFDNLNLVPNGGTASAGFVKFKISQKPNNPRGTLIPNSAAVFLGFDAPVQTATYTHVVDSTDLLTFVLTDVDEPLVPGVEIAAYPNPFTSSILFEVEGRPFQNLTVTLFDMSGQLVAREKASGNKLQLPRRSLLAGMYAYRLEGDGLLLNTGKVLVR